MPKVKAATRKRWRPRKSASETSESRTVQIKRTREGKSDRPVITIDKPESYYYFFGAGRADGNALMKDILGGKGANLAEMASAGIAVPPGFTVSTDVCRLYYDNGMEVPKPIDH